MADSNATQVAAEESFDAALWSARELVLQCAAWSKPNRDANWVGSMISVWIGGRVYWADRGRDYLHLTVAEEHEARLLTLFPEAERESVKMQHEKLRQYRIKLPERQGRPIDD